MRDRAHDAPGAASAGLRRRRRLPPASASDAAPVPAPDADEHDDADEGDEREPGDAALAAAARR